MSKYNEEEEDESVWNSNPMKISIPAEEKNPADEDEEEKASPVTGMPVAKSPVPSGPGSAATGVAPGAKSPAPVPAATAVAAPKLGECCKRMDNEIKQETNVLKWKDHKENPIIVFSHNLNKILHCPWCGAKIPTVS